MLKLKLRKFCGLIPTFVEVTGGKLVGEGALLQIRLTTSKAKLDSKLDKPDDSRVAKRLKT